MPNQLPSHYLIIPALQLAISAIKMILYLAAMFVCSLSLCQWIWQSARFWLQQHKGTRELYQIARPNKIHTDFVHPDKVPREKGQNKYNTGIILIKITFFGTIILHALPDNAVQCSSGERGIWEILVPTNMKSLLEKSKNFSLVHFAANGRWPLEKWLLRQS